MAVQKETLEERSRKTLNQYAEPETLEVAFSTEDTSLQLARVRQLKATLRIANKGSEEDQMLAMQAAIATLSSIAPNNSMEAMLACQMVATHDAAIDCFQTAMEAEDSKDYRIKNINLAHKLISLYTQLLHTLDRHRGNDRRHSVMGGNGRFLHPNGD